MSSALPEHNAHTEVAQLDPRASGIVDSSSFSYADVSKAARVASGVLHVSRTISSFSFAVAKVSVFAMFHSSFNIAANMC